MNLSYSIYSQFDELDDEQVNTNENNSIDMAYLYADPLVKKNLILNKIDLVSNVPLELDVEYQQIVNALKETKKHIKIQKEAINQKNISKILQKMPKIIHISTHGGVEFDEGFLCIEGRPNTNLIGLE